MFIFFLQNFDYNPAAINMYHDNQTSQNVFESYTASQENRQPLMKSNFNHLRQPLHPIQQFPMQAPHQSALQRKRILICGKVYCEVPKIGKYKA